MTLHDIGFDSSEVEQYMRLFLKKEDRYPKSQNASALN